MPMEDGIELEPDEMTVKEEFLATVNDLIDTCFGNGYVQRDGEVVEVEFPVWYAGNFPERVAGVDPGEAEAVGRTAALEAAVAVAYRLAESIPVGAPQFWVALDAAVTAVVREVILGLAKGRDYSVHEPAIAKAQELLEELGGYIQHVYDVVVEFDDGEEWEAE